MIELNNIETNRPASDLQHSTTNNCTFDSSAPNNMPNPFYAEDYNISNFVYTQFGFTNPGKGVTFWSANDYLTGIGFATRTGIGAFYFYIPIPNPDIPDPHPVVPYYEPETPGRVFWDYLSTFWNFLIDKDRKLFENFWDALSKAGYDLLKRAQRFFETTAPENARIDVLEDYYDILIGPLHSKPINLDPTAKTPNYIIKPLSTKLIEPLYDEANNSVYRDMIEVSASDYYKLRQIGLENYVVVQVKKEDINDRAFKVYNLLSSEEAHDRPAFAEINETIHNIIIKESGTNTSITANKLIDSAATFQTNGIKIGDVVKNTTDATETTVLTVDSEIQLTLNADIFPTPAGDDYQIYENNIGRIGLTADDYTEDVSDYKVLIYVNNGPATAVDWTSSGLEVTVNTTEGKDVDDIIDLINASDPDKWATASNRSPKGKTDIPIMADDTVTFPDDAPKFKNLPNYLFKEESEGRYYPSTGKNWEWFDGYSSADGDPGTTGLGEWVDSLSMFKYMIEIEGDLSYIGDESFTIYLTTGKLYDVLLYVSDLPILQNFIDSTKGVPFYKDIDYRFYNNTIEFFEDIFEKKRAEPETYLYCPKVSIIEHMLFEMYGTMVNVPNWKDYNYNNISAKAGINALLKSLQNASNLKDYERALNVYYGLPVAPEGAEVIGLYESYGYKVIGKIGSDITLDIPTGESLHPFIQPGGRFMVEGKKDVNISSIVNRLDAIITLEDASQVEIDDLFYIKLNNRFIIKSFFAEDTDDPGYIEVYIREGKAPIQHVIDVMQLISEGTQYPEILVYGTEKLDHNYNGIYHVTEAIQTGGIVKLAVYKREELDAAIYNDYIGVTTLDVGAGFAHFAWPTHKFLYLYLNTDRYFKAYLDAPLDTIYDAEDVLEKYDIIARNASVLNKEFFPGWTQFDHFRRYSGINLESDIVEVTSIMPGIEFGNYFPSASVKLK